MGKPHRRRRAKSASLKGKFDLVKKSPTPCPRIKLLASMTAKAPEALSSGQSLGLVSFEFFCDKPEEGKIRRGSL
jgi:hypothetical protein